MSSLTLLLDNALLELPYWVSLLSYVVLLAIIVVPSLLFHWVRPSGAISALVLGLFVLCLGGFSAFLILLFFFVLGSGATKLSSRILPKEREGRGRGWRQVVANGAPALLALIISVYSPYHYEALVAFAAALAEAAADTSSSEIGRLSHYAPVSIITMTPVRRGTNGGVTVLGLLAAIFASFLIGILFIGTYALDFRALALITASGFFGSVLDSFLGATVQVVYRDEKGNECDEKGENRERIRGIPFIDNNAVNLISSAFSSLLAFLLILL